MERPNLLFLITDQQRADTVDPTSPCRMPNVAGLAQRGAQFDRCYAPNPICSPTRASLFTGLLPHSHGMVDCTHTVEPYRAKLKHDVPFWTRRLQDAGYRTGYFGKWHVERSNDLSRFGFDAYETDLRLVGVHDEDRVLSHSHSVRQPGYRDFLLYGVVDTPASETREHYLYSRGIEFLEEDSEQPWALFISTEAPHDPFVVPRDYYERYDPSTIPKPASFDDDLDDRPTIYRRAQSVWRDLEWRHYAEATACYYGLCSLIDDQVGRILAKLRQLRQLDDTLIVFTSDHGDYLGAHRLMLKGVPAFEEAYRVPLVLAGPGVPAGRRIDAVTSLLDLAPTLTTLTSGDDFAGHGRSLLPLLQGEGDDWPNEAFAEMHGQRFFYTQRLLWQDNFKYVFNGFDVDELYDLAQDPHELHNLAGDPAYRQVLEEMAARMWTIVRETDDFNMFDAQYGMFRFAPVGPEAAGEES